MPDESCSMFKTLGFVSIEGLKSSGAGTVHSYAVCRQKKNQTNGTYTAPGRNELRDILPQKI